MSQEGLSRYLSARTKPDPWALSVWFSGTYQLCLFNPSAYIKIFPQHLDKEHLDQGQQSALKTTLDHGMKKVFFFFCTPYRQVSYSDVLHPLVLQGLGTSREISHPLYSSGWVSFSVLLILERFNISAISFRRNEPVGNKNASPKEKSKCSS